MARKIMQNRVMNYCAFFVFFLALGPVLSSLQAQCIIVVDGVEQGLTLETARTEQAAEDAYDMIPWQSVPYCVFETPSWLLSGCYGYVPACISLVPWTARAVCLDGTWYESSGNRYCALALYDPCESWAGTWDVVCDTQPAIGDGPFVADGNWPVLSSSQASPTYMSQNYYLLWTFSDDFASCSGDCTHAAEYSVAGSDSWTTLSVSNDAEAGYAYVELPITGLENATTYAFRFTVTDCAGQSTQSQTYYFRVATSDAPPVITGGPFLATGFWPVLSTSATRAAVLTQNEYALWTFSDDYASCAGLCTHRARYRLLGDTAWTWITVSADPTGKKYAYVTLPVEGLGVGTYQFYFDVRDCAGQRTYAPKIYYFKVE